MKIGVTGHQKREGISWVWVSSTLREEISRLPSVSTAWTSLAAGTDQVFAEVALKLEIPVTAVIPLEGYERFFSGADLQGFRRLLTQCESVQLRWKGDPEQAFYEAGRYIVDHSDCLLAVWDALAAEGLGGTAEIVEYAVTRGKRVVHLNPMEKSVQHRAARTRA